MRYHFRRQRFTSCSSLRARQENYYGDALSNMSSSFTLLDMRGCDFCSLLRAAHKEAQQCRRRKIRRRRQLERPRSRLSFSILLGGMRVVILVTRCRQDFAIQAD